MRKTFIFASVLVFYLSLTSFLFAAPTESAPPVNSSRIDEDFGYRDTRHIQMPKSDWIESEKAFYRAILKREAYDVLIIPFQVQRYAVDRIERFLMTSYLAHRISLDNQFKLPDPALVAKALGETARTFDENEIYGLANDLKVKVLIKGYVGHNREEKMRLTIVVQNREQNSSFTPDSRRRQIDWYDIPFDDLDLPSEAFLSRLEDIATKTGLALPPTVNRPKYKTTRPLLLPTILSIQSEKPISPVMSAYHLQFLGMLYPGQTPAMEHLFERSLVALSRVPPNPLIMPF